MASFTAAAENPTPGFFFFGALSAPLLIDNSADTNTILKITADFGMRVTPVCGDSCIIGRIS